MAIIDTERDVIVIRIVYDGPPFSGKTTSIHTLGNLLGENNPVFSPEESDGKTLYFDWMEYIGGLFKGYGLSCQIISVPGQLSLEKRRHFLLRTADAVIFVLDAGEKKTEIPLLYFKDLQNVLSLQPDEETVKVVIQANKQDKPNAFSAEQLKTEVFYNYPEIKIIESTATVGKGVRETFVLAVRQAIERADALMAKKQLASGKPDITNGEELLAVLQKTITLKSVTSDTDAVVQTQTKESNEAIQLPEEPIVSFEDLDASEPESKSIEEHPLDTPQRADNSITIKNKEFFADETQELVNKLLEQPKEQPAPELIIEESAKQGVSFEDLDLSKEEQELTIQRDNNSEIIEQTSPPADEINEPVKKTLEQSPEPLSFDDLDLETSQNLPALENQPAENTEPPAGSKDELEVESINLPNEETTILVEDEISQQSRSSDENWESFEENTCELPEQTVSFEHLDLSKDEVSQLIESSVETPTLNQDEIEDMKFVIVSDKEVDAQTKPSSDEDVEKFISDEEFEEITSFDEEQSRSSDDEQYISDEEFEEYISFDGEFKDSILSDQEFFVLPDELETFTTLPEELEGVDDDPLPENQETEPVDEINLPPLIETENHPDPALPTEVPNQSVSLPSFSGKKQLPQFPDEDTPIQWIWPPLSGSHILANLFKQSLRPHLQPDGTWVINTKNDWRCFSKWHWSYTTIEQAREKLRANMCMHLQCSPFLSEQRCVAITHDVFKETWRLWQIVHLELSLAEYLIKALQEERVEKLVLETVKCASHYVEALQQSTRYPPLLELSLENIGLDEEQKLIYLGCIEEENATQAIQPSQNQETLSEIITMVFAEPIARTGKHLEIAAIVKGFDQLHQIEPPYLIESLKNLFLNQQT